MRLATTTMFIALGLGSPARAADPLWVRLRAPMNASAHEIEGVVIAEYRNDAGLCVPLGSKVIGNLEAGSSRQRLQTRFHSLRLNGLDYPMDASVLEVDNARETVTADGTILALDPLRKRPGKVEILLLAAAHAHPAALAAFEGSKLALRRVDHPSVDYPAGIDLALRLERPPALPCPVGDSLIVPVLPGESFGKLPNRTRTEAGNESDWVNLAFASNREELLDSFEAAGWLSAQRLSLRADVKVFLAVAAHHAYRSGPVSKLLINGQPPDFVFQRQNNTFAKRHHIRIWATGGEWQGRPLWVAAATHDIGISFSPVTKTMTHRIDPFVDHERAKVVNDLRFAGVVRAAARLPRPEIPSTSRNATGDAIHTDGDLWVLRLAGAPASKEK